MIRLPKMQPQRCYVCKRRAYYMHLGRFYCTETECQCVAADMKTLRQARARLRARGWVIA